MNNISELFCNNCGKNGHLFHICKIPITSLGIICFRYFENEIQFLMIRRKDTLGYIDFLRGKFSAYQRNYILNMLNQMTQYEKSVLIKKYNVVKSGGTIPNLKERILLLINGVNKNGVKYDLLDLIKESNMNPIWDEPEWGFPKGRRNAQESDYYCAIREFTEETGYRNSKLKNIRNILPVEETFTGSNYNSYRHKYFLMYMGFEDSIANNNFQKSEVSKMEWKNLPECLNCIRPYNLEKKRIIQNVYNCLNTTMLLTLTKNNIN